MKLREENGQYKYDYLIREIPEGIEPEYQKGYAVKGESEKGIQINTNKQNTKEQIKLVTFGGSYSKMTKPKERVSRDKIHTPRVDGYIYCDAEYVISKMGYYFDYLKGRPIKCNMEDNIIYVESYNRDNDYDGLAQQAISKCPNISKDYSKKYTK